MMLSDSQRELSVDYSQINTQHTPYCIMCGKDRSVLVLPEPDDDNTVLTRPVITHYMEVSHYFQALVKTRDHSHRSYRPIT